MRVDTIVTVSIPVSLEYDEDDIPTIDRIRDGAIKNFMDHPALQASCDLEGYVDRVIVNEGRILCS